MVDTTHRPEIRVRVPACSPRVLIDGVLIRLAVPDRMPMPMLLSALALSMLVAGFALTVAYFLAPEFPGGPAAAWVIGGVVALFAVSGVLGGFIGGWYLGNARGPLAVYRLASGEIDFPHMKLTLKREDILGMDFVVGGYYWKRADAGWGRERLFQMYCTVRDGDAEKRVIVHSDSTNLVKPWGAFAREAGLALQRHQVPRQHWPRLE